MNFKDKKSNGASSRRSKSKSKLSMVDKTEGKDFASVTGSQDFKWYFSGNPNGTCRKSDEQRT